MAPKPKPPPAFAGPLLPVGSIVDAGWWSTSFKITRRFEADAAASEVLLAVDQQTSEEVVLKAELLNSAASQVYHDRNVLDWLLRGRGQAESPLEVSWKPPLVGLPRLHQSCTTRLIMHTRGELKMRLFAMEKLGPSLDQVAANYADGLAACAVRTIGRQLLAALEYIHSNGYIHCDVKPANFLLKGGSVYVVDFGISKKYVERTFLKPSERAKDPSASAAPIIRHSKLKGTGEGTREWTSVFTERKDQLGRRDDIEAFAFVLLKLASGHLPWEELVKSESARPPPVKKLSKAEEQKQTNARIAAKQRQPQELCAAIADPALRRSVETVLSVARGLQPEERPDYALLQAALASSDSKRDGAPL